MTTMELEKVQSQLRDVIAGMIPGDPLVITNDGEPVATLTRNQPRSWPCKAGSGRTESFWMAPDFDAPMEEFREYME